MAATKFKTSAISAIVLASVLTPLLCYERAEAGLGQQNEAIRQKSDQLAKLQPENERLSNLLAQRENSEALPDGQLSELLKFRGEVGSLRGEVRKLTEVSAIREHIAQLPLEQVWPARVNQLKKWLEEHPSENVPETKQMPDRTWLNSMYPFSGETDEECQRAMSVVRENAEAPTRNSLATAFRKYVEANGGQFPTDLSQLKPFINPPIDEDVLGRYVIVPSKSLVHELQPGGDWVITERAPVNEAQDGRHAISLNSSAMANQSVTNRWMLVP